MMMLEFKAMRNETTRSTTAARPKVISKAAARDADAEEGEETSLKEETREPIADFSTNNLASKITVKGNHA